MDALNSISVQSNYIKKQNQNKKNLAQKDVAISNPSVKSPSGDVWKAMVGIVPEDVSNKADKLINKFALTGKLGIHDISSLKNAIKQGNAQSENVAMLLTLVNEKSVNPKTLKYICKDGMMSDGMEKDIRMIFNARANGIDPKDAYIPHVSSKEEGLSSAQVGDIFEVEGQKNVFIKNREGQAEQLKMDKEMMIKLFPPAERFANAQTYSADCYFVSSVNSMMDNPNSRPYFLQCFEQDGEDIKIKFPSSDFVYTAKNAQMPKAYKGNFVVGSVGMKLIEYAYGEFLEDRVAKQVRDVQGSAIEKLQEKLNSTSDTKEKKEIESQIKAYQFVLDRFNTDQARKKHEWVVSLDDYRNPEMSDSDGVILRSLNQMNTYRKTSYETPGDYYRGDGGYMEDVFLDFGFKETEVYAMEDPKLEEILTNPDSAKEYIFSGGTKNEGKRNLLRAELIMDRSLSMYGAHAYRISPSYDEKGNVVFKVSNPWNSSHNSILTLEQMKQFFSQIHMAKIQ